MLKSVPLHSIEHGAQAVSIRQRRTDSPHSRVVSEIDGGFVDVYGR